jgi:hypothetical protein
MSKEFYLPDDDNGKEAWLNNFAAKLPTYATTLGLAAATITQTEADATNFTAGMTALTAYKKYAKNITAYKNHLRDGDVNNTPIGTLADPPDLPAFSASIIGNIFGRNRKLVNTLKNNANYTLAIGQNLGIEGTEENTGGPATQKSAAEKPILTIVLQSGGHPLVKWTKGINTSLKIMVDRGTGVFGFLAIDTHPDYLDTAPLPVIGTSAIWKYMAIYLDSDDDEIGQWSEVAQVTVTGTP